MPEFLIETYAPRDAPDVAALRAQDAALAAEQVRAAGMRGGVRPAAGDPP